MKKKDLITFTNEKDNRRIVAIENFSQYALAFGLFGIAIVNIMKARCEESYGCKNDDGRDAMNEIYKAFASVEEE